MSEPSPTILAAEAQVLRFVSDIWLSKPGETERACGRLLGEWADRLKAASADTEGRRDVD
jgi:hypothetical protein